MILSSDFRLNTILGIVLQISSAVFALENDFCQLYDGKTGSCKEYTSCAAQLKGQPIKICGYTTTAAIVCCPSPVAETKVQRLSEQKCSEFQKLTLSPIGITGLFFDSNKKLAYRGAKCDFSVGVIVGGEKTKPGEFPHMAAIGWRSGISYEFSCGGALISEYFVLTAAHCATDESGISPSVVRLGEQNLVKDDDNAQPVDYDIAEFRKHPDYRPLESRYNDIALIKLASRVKFSKFVRPACLWSSFEFNKGKVLATGFGVTEYWGDKSDELLKVSLNIYDNSVCNNVYGFSSRLLKNGIVDSQLCSGVLEGGKDTCQGDSGGPLQIALDDNKCVYHLVGITSFGKYCGGKNGPGVYTRVFYYLDWIEQNVWN